jgi:hypothetical protein
MGTSAPFIFCFLKILKLHIFMYFKIMILNMQIDMHMRSVIKKVGLKNTLYFVKYKKDKFLTVNSSTQVRLLLENLSFLYFLKYKVFVNGTFLCTHLVSKSIYIFNHIIFEDTKVRGFEKFQKTKNYRGTGAHVHKTFSVFCPIFFICLQ